MNPLRAEVAQLLGGANFKLRGAAYILGRDALHPEEIDQAYVSVVDAVNLASIAYLRHAGYSANLKDEQGARRLIKMVYERLRRARTNGAPSEDQVLLLVEPRNTSVHQGLPAATETEQGLAALQLGQAYVAAIARITGVT